MPSLLEGAQLQADALNAAADGSPYAAYVDPAEALPNRPCWLMAPPSLDLGTLGGASEVEWRVIALSSYEAGDLRALTELQELIRLADVALGIQRAEPIQYQLTRDTTRIAAYRLSVTDYLVLEAPSTVPALVTANV